uniref:ATP synthase subunit d, mitochondrial n=1 Tax=Ciona intestinalis TaxID=7719 RepID=F6PM15_CIOIN
MAARQSVIKAVEWGKILERTRPDMKSTIGAFKAKSDGIFNNYVKSKDVKLDIDWAYYQSAVANKALVADFEKQFKAYKVPKPIDTKSKELEDKTAKDNEAVKKFLQETEENLTEVMMTVDRLNSLPPFEQMTIDDIFENFPQVKPDYKKIPHWPHAEIFYVLFSVRAWWHRRKKYTV